MIEGALLAQALAALWAERKGQKLCLHTECRSTINPDYKLLNHK